MPPLRREVLSILRAKLASIFTIKPRTLRRKYLPETMGPGVALFDYDNDGRLDIFLVNGAPLSDRGGAMNPALLSVLVLAIATDARGRVY